MSGRLRSAPPPGTPLKCALAGGFVEELSHSGIYLGDGRVAELRGDGRLVAVPLSDFLNGDAGALDVFALRTGFRIHAACDAAGGAPLASSAAAGTAWNLTVGKGGRLRVPYDLLSDNCHRFTAGCVRGSFKGEEKGEWMIGRLEGVIADTLNGGRPVIWRAVHPDTPGFRYAATPGKHLQHWGAMLWGIRRVLAP